MASNYSAVYLGYIDEQVSSKNQHHLNYSVSKIGGTPNWCMSEYEIPSCFYCERKLVLVIQLYAPLENSPYHRTLYVFACISPSCWNKSRSWVCIRSQALDTRQTVVSSMSREESPSESWMDGEDDWGDSDIDDGNGNICPSSQLMSFMSRNLKTYNDLGDTNVYNWNERKSKSKSKSNSNSKSKSNSNTLTDVSDCMENAMNLNEKKNKKFKNSEKLSKLHRPSEISVPLPHKKNGKKKSRLIERINAGDTNANDSLCGAVGMQSNEGESMEASASIEGSEEDMVAVETPEKPVTDIPALFKEVPIIDKKLDVLFISYFIDTGIEPAEDTNFSAHERELFQRYTSSAQDFKEENSFGIGKKGGDNIYEKHSAHHGDKFLHKFKKRISRSPQQILRYCREESASPLWMRPPSQGAPKACEWCGGRMIFEAQIMPQLVYCLRVKDLPSTALEFGTVALYTCTSSCWAEGDKMRREFCFVQAED